MRKAGERKETGEGRREKNAEVLEGRGEEEEEAGTGGGGRSERKCCAGWITVCLSSGMV